MPYEQIITLLDRGAVLAGCGPMRLVISAWVGKVPQPDMAIRAARESFRYLEEVAQLRGHLSRNWRLIHGPAGVSLPDRMWESVRAIGDEDLTPMAAVAGTIGDAVADYLFDRGMTKVVVDNGGDVAIRLRGSATARVGIRPSIRDKEISHILSLDAAEPSWGVATSGLGGRSFTRGIASAVTVMARSASLADAAATAIANAAFIPDDAVIQRLAEEMDPDTDIRGIPVTVKVGQLSEGKKAVAARKGLHKAERLCRQGLILGALVAVDGIRAMTRVMEERIILAQ
jgi:hypothetical protein